MKNTVNDGGYVYEVLVASMRHELTHFVRGVCRSRLSSEDIVQDALIKAWQCWDTWVPDDPEDPVRCARAWMFRICSNLVLDRVIAEKRSENKLRRAVSDVTSWCHRPEWDSGLPGQGNMSGGHHGGMQNNRVDQLRAVEPVVVPNDVGPEVEQAISRLSPRRRQIVRARFVDGKTSDVIAEELHLKRVTVRTNLMRALDDLVPLLAVHAREEYGLNRVSGPRAFGREASEREESDADSVDSVVA